MFFRPNRSLALFAVTVAVVQLNCGETPPSSPVAAVRDSAGVRIVANEGSAWPEEAGWHVGEATLHIGGHDADPENQLYEVRGGALLSDGRVVVASNGSHDLRFYDLAGRFLGSAGREGQGPGEFAGLWRMVRYSGDSLLVWDNRNMRLSVHDLQGRFARSFKLEASEEGVARFPGMRPIAFSDGSVLGLEWLGADLMAADPGAVQLEAELFLFDGEGVELASVGSFPWMEFWVGDEEVTMQNGMSTYMKSPLLFGRTLFLAAHDSVFWAGTGGPALTLYDQRGQLLQRVRRADLDPVAVTPEMVQREVAVRMAGVEAMNNGPDAVARMRRLFESMPAADSLPAYQNALTDAEGNLWAKRHPGVEDPDDPRPSAWDVFEPGGRFLGTVELPPRFDPLDIGRDYVLGVRRDDLDIEHVLLLPLLKEQGGRGSPALS